MNLIKKPTKDHIAWQNREFYYEMSIETTASSSDLPAFRKKLKKLIDSNKSGSIKMNAERVTEPSIEMIQNELCLERAINLSIEHIDKNITIDGLAIKRLTLRCADKKRPLVTIKNSIIKKLTVNTISSGELRIKIENSGIFTLKMEKESIFNLTMAASYIWNIQCPHENNPISGTVNIGEDVSFGTKQINGAFAEKQGYQNMRHHMMKLNNPLAAYKFHEIELRTERNADKFLTNKIVSYLYDLFSVYGNSILRPVLWFILFFLIFTFLTIHYGNPIWVNEVSPQGWMKIFCEDSYTSDVSKAFTYTAQNTLNPLGILGYKNMFVLQNGFIATINILYNLISITLITLIVLAIRKKFRIQSSN
jgi:hypothetical protein